jgi:uncharacterized repeat protein (TIGR02543 family)
MDCTCTSACIHVVKATDFITYDKYQSNQTLYARWEKNRIVFDINGCDAEPIEDILYGSKYENNSIITLPGLTWSYDITCIAFGTEENTKYKGKIYKTFLGWEDENGNIITQIDILQPGLGVVNLKAKWSESYVWDAPVFEVTGYEIREWYFDTYYTEVITRSTSWEDFVAALKENNFYVYSKKIATKYTISYENTKGAKNDNVEEYTIESPKIVLSDIIVDGYIFNGWYNGDKKITEIPKYSFGDIVLTARWTPIAYTITYENLKGASNANNENTYTIEDEVALENLSDVEGYIFKGWYTFENGGTKVTSIEKGCIGNKVYYAQWTPIVYTITYENTKGVINLNNPTTYTIEDEVIFAALPNIEGYAFNGWYTEDGTKVGSIAKGSTGDKVYYAGWTENGYSIKYHNVYDAQNPNPDSYTIETETFTIKDIQRTGYNFKGWYSNSNLTVPLDTTIEIGSAGEINCYAKWEAIEYTISYNLNGGRTSVSNIEKYTIESDSIIVNAPSKDGYKFVGWEGTGINGRTENLVIYKGTTGNKVYEAKYEALVYTITYILDGATNATANPTSYTIETDTIYLSNPQKTGYTFNGWREGSEIPKGTIGNKTFTVNLSPTPYDIIWNFAGGTGNGEYPVSYTIESNNITVKDPIKTGYEFVGWKDATGNIVSIIELNGCTGKKSFTADWKGLPYTITFNANGGSVAETSREIIFDDKGTYGNLPTPNKTGYAFAGWYTEKNGGEKVTATTQIKAANMTLYAVWIKNNYTDFQLRTPETVISVHGTNSGCGNKLGISFDELTREELKVLKEELGYTNITVHIEFQSQEVSADCGNIILFKGLSSGAQSTDGAINLTNGKFLSNKSWCSDSTYSSVRATINTDRLVVDWWKISMSTYHLEFEFSVDELLDDNGMFTIGFGVSGNSSEYWTLGSMAIFIKFTK